MTDDFVTGFPAEVSHGLCPECIVLLYPTIGEPLPFPGPSSMTGRVVFPSQDGEEGPWR